MNISGDAAESIVKFSIEGVEVAAKITGTTAKEIGVLLYALLKDKKQTKGKTTLTNMLKSGKELKIFTIKQEDFKKFASESKRYGILYCALVNAKNKDKDGIIDIMVKTEDAARINRIVDRFIVNYDEATIKSEINKTREKSSNPSSAKAEKSPLSKPSSQMHRTSGQGTKPRKSVRKKLEDIKKGLEKQPRKQKVKSEKVK